MDVRSLSMPAAPVNATGPKKEPMSAAEKAKLKTACQDFESVFLKQMLSKMRESVPKSDLMGDTKGEDMFKGMLDEQLSKQMALSGGMGVGSVLYKQLTEGK